MLNRIGIGLNNLIRIHNSLLRFSYDQKYTNYCFISNTGTGIHAVKKKNFRPNSSPDENNFAHNVLTNLPDYNKTTIDIRKIVIEDKDKKKRSWKRHKSTNIAEEGSFRNYTELIDAIKKCETLEVPFLLRTLHFLSDSNKRLQLSDSELIQLLLSLVARASSYSNIIKENYKLFNLLSEESIRRTVHWNKDQILLLADIWYAISKPWSSIYHSHAVNMLYANPMTLSSYQFIQGFFYINLLRKYDFDIRQPIIEQKIEEFIQDVRVEELSIITMGFFKTKNIIKNVSLLRKIVELLVTHKQIISDFCVCSIFKLLRQSFNGLHFDHSQLCSTTLREFKSEVGRLNHYSLVLLASIGNHLNLYDEALLTEIMDLLVPKFSTMRLKDIERLSFIAMNSRAFVTKPNFCESVEQELLKPTRSEENKFHFTSFLSCTYYLACMGHYNSHIISKALTINDSSIASGAQKSLILKYTRLNHLYQLDMMLQLDGPENYDGYRLTKDYSKSLMKKYVQRLPSTSVPNSTAEERKFLVLSETMLKMMTEEFMAVDFIVPNSSLPQILFCTDGLCNLRPFPHSAFDYAPEEVKPVLKSHEDLTWCAVLAATRKSYLHGAHRLRGEITLRIRLLEKLGYKVILIPTSDEITTEEMSRNVLKCVQKFIHEKELKKLEANFKYYKKRCV